MIAAYSISRVFFVREQVCDTSSLLLFCNGQIVGSIARPILPVVFMLLDGVQLALMKNRRIRSHIHHIRTVEHPNEGHSERGQTSQQRAIFAQLPL